MTLRVQFVEEKPSKPRDRKREAYNAQFRDVKWTPCDPVPLKEGSAAVHFRGVVDWQVMNAARTCLHVVKAECVKLSDGRCVLTTAGANAIRAAQESDGPEEETK